MFVNWLRADDFPHETEIASPEWKDIEAAVRRLNGDTRSTVTLAGKADGAFLAICGGEDGVLVCFAIDDHGNEFKLLNGQPDSDETIRVFMGQYNIRSANEAADIQTALCVAETYARTGQRDQRFAWRNM